MSVHAVIKEVFIEHPTWVKYYSKLSPDDTVVNKIATVLGLYSKRETTYDWL